MPGPINIETVDHYPYIPDTGTPPRRPSVAILQTCKTINEEGIPILYSQNRFSITLCMSLNFLAISNLLLPLTNDLVVNLHRFAGVPPSSRCRPASSVFLGSLRWTTISHLTFLAFHVNTPTPDGKESLFRLPRTSFACTGADILVRFRVFDFDPSSSGPDEYMAKCISNWISVNVMAVELVNFQTALEIFTKQISLDI